MLIPPWQIIQPSNCVDVLLNGPFSQDVVPQDEDLEVIVDEHCLWQELQMAVGQVSLGWKLGCCLKWTNK